MEPAASTPTTPSSAAGTGCPVWPPSLVKTDYSSGSSLSELIVSRSPSAASSFSSPPAAVGLPRDEARELEEEVNFVDHEYFNSFPPGYRFDPFEDELLEHYLAKKVLGQPVPVNKIMEVNLYKYNPGTLAAKYKNCGENRWYFFTPRDRKYKHGKRPNRAAGDGYWKATGADKVVRKPNGVKVGYKKALVFYQGKPPKGVKTNWIMHEYRVDEQPVPRPRANQDVDDMRLDDYVLCMIYKKVGNGNNRRALRQREDVVDDSFSPDQANASPEIHHAPIAQMVHDPLAVDDRALHPHYFFNRYEQENNLSMPATHYVNHASTEDMNNFYLGEDIWEPSHSPLNYDHHHVYEGFGAHQSAGGNGLAMSPWNNSSSMGPLFFQSNP